MSEMTSRRSMMTSPPLVMMTMGGTVLLIAALATSAWRGAGWSGFVWLVVSLVQVAIRAPHLVRNRSNRIAVRRADRLERWWFVAVSLTGLVLPLIHLTTGLFAAADYVLPGWATAAGAALQVPALWLFWRTHADLGRNWSPALEVREGHTLASGGIYARVRHPMYAAIGLSVLSQALLIPNWIAGALAIPAFAAMLAVRIPREEAMLRERFGEAYVAYAARTRRLIPGVWGW
jgi:protein-S-isoprenylcysteine O-methyltransferase Ste14